MKKTAITPTREENYPEWYQQVIKHADMAENSPVRGCAVLKPWGYAIWEHLQKYLDTQIKEQGFFNCYFPMFIPLSRFEKEAEHIEGFAKECAVVTHTRLVKNEKGQLIPSNPLEEALVVRPTSETIINEMLAKWIHSYRDLPYGVNQWCNIVRWEMRPRIFLRTTEFLWQEGHTAHATRENADETARTMLSVYETFAKEVLSIPVLAGEKSKNERFPGADNTYTIEAMMQDGKALQAGTSHFLGQNFSKPFEIRYLSQEGNLEYAWTTSWGVSTRLIGALIMSHSDDNGLVLPPRVAPKHVVILPILRDKNTEDILNYAKTLYERIKKTSYQGDPVRVHLDTNDQGSAGKAWHWYKKGVPLIVEVGAKELAQNTVFVRQRSEDYYAPESMSNESFIESIEPRLQQIQEALYLRAKERMEKQSVRISSEKELYQLFSGDINDEKSAQGVFAYGYYSEDKAIEEKLKSDLAVTVRCFPFSESSTGPCIFSGKENARIAVFAKSY